MIQSLRPGFEQFLDLSVEPVGDGAAEAHHLLSNRSFLIDQDGGGKTRHSVFFDDLFRCQGYGVGDPHGLDEFSHHAPIPLVHAQADHLEALRLVVLVEGHKMGDRLPTGTTPGGPEVKKDDLPPQIGEADFLVFEGHEGKLWSFALGSSPFASTMGKKKEGDKIDDTSPQILFQETLQRPFSPISILLRFQSAFSTMATSRAFGTAPTI